MQRRCGSSFHACCARCRYNVGRLLRGPRGVCRTYRSFRADNRHSKGRPVVYCCQNPATALLETLVHIEMDAEDRPEHFQVLKIEGPDSIARERIEYAGLPAGWTEDIPATQAIGSSWLVSHRSLLLEVPSVLVPETWNVLVNPLHPEARQLTITDVMQHPFDTRLF